MFYVYRYMVGDQWIYVGKSANNIDQRIYDHSKDKRFEVYPDAVIEYCELNSKTDMDITESMLIKTMHPVINITDKTDGSIPFCFQEEMIIWNPYSRQHPKKCLEHKQKQKRPVVKRDQIIKEESCVFCNARIHNERYGAAHFHTGIPAMYMCLQCAKCSDFMNKFNCLVEERRKIS